MAERKSVGENPAAASGSSSLKMKAPGKFLPGGVCERLGGAFAAFLRRFFWSVSNQTRQSRVLTDYE
jgi:hypothetical protein